MRAQVGRLIAPGFVGEAGAAQLREIPRYLAAVASTAASGSTPRSPGTAS